jgi:hypothetical protein
MKVNQTIVTLSDVFQAHWERFYHKIRRPDGVSASVETPRLNLPNSDASNSAKQKERHFKILVDIILFKNFFNYDCDVTKSNVIRNTCGHGFFLSLEKELMSLNPKIIWLIPEINVKQLPFLFHNTSFISNVHGFFTNLNMDNFISMAFSQDVRIAIVP